MDGRIERGAIDADSERSVRAQLTKRGLVVISVAERGAGKHAGGGRFGPRISNAELTWATREMASMLAASMPLEAALRGVIEEAEKKPTRDAFTAVLEDVLSGTPFAKALASRPRDFPEVYRALVNAGEKSGELARVMERLADYIESANALRAKVVTAFIYPIIVMVISVCIVVFMLGYVVPQVVSAFTQARQDLPFITQVMLVLSGFLRDYGLAALGGLAAAFWLWRLWLRDPTAKLNWHARMLRLPIFGRVVLEVNTARFASTLAILTDAGVSLLDALAAARQTMGNEVLRQSVEAVTAQVREGAALGLALRLQNKTRKTFPPVLVRYVANGEKSGTLVPMLQRTAETLSRHVAQRVMVMTAMLEPLMILVMGGVVLTIVLAIMLPIIEMNQMVM